jgi:hypothetical protein
LLKDHDKGKKTNTDELTQDVTQNIQVEDISQLPNHIEDDNTDKNIDGNRPFDQSVGVKKQ